MNRPSFLIATILAALPGLAGCASTLEGEEGPSEVATDDLRRFKPSEVVGTIGFGETKTIHHAGAPTYRAYAFDAESGDRIELRVSAASHDAMVWLLDASNRTLKFVNAFSNTDEEVIEYSISATGRYYVAFRDADYEPAQFSVSLTKVGSPPGASPFPSCTGTPRFPTTGPLKIHTNDAPAALTDTIVTRSCDAFGTCTSWTEIEGGPPIQLDGASFTLDPDRSIAIQTWSPRIDMGDRSCTKNSRIQATLAADGTGVGASEPAHATCSAGAGTFSGAVFGEKSSPSLVLGSGCLSITEPEPTGRYGQQLWRSALVTW